MVWWRPSMQFRLLNHMWFNTILNAINRQETEMTALEIYEYLYN
jgi:hypothetical protein